MRAELRCVNAPAQPSRLFLSATGTDAGKTLLAAALCHQLQAQGESVRVLKPVASGVRPDDAESDPAILARLQSHAPASVCLHALRAPTLPALAAARENVALDWPRILAFCAPGPERHQLVEGAGGLFSPLTATRTNADLAQALSLPVLLVAGTYLGAVGHTLATLRAAAAQGVRIAGLCLNASDAPDALTPAVMRSALETLAPLPPIVHLPRLCGLHPWESAPDLLPWLWECARQTVGFPPGG